MSERDKPTLHTAAAALNTPRPAPPAPEPPAPCCDCRERMERYRVAVGAAEERLIAIGEMIDGCADTPSAPDGLPQMILHEVRAALLTIGEAHGPGRV